MVYLLEPAQGVNHPAAAVVSFRWQAVGGATSYTLTVCMSTGCGGGGQVFQQGVSGTSHATSMSPGSYQFTVQAFSGAAPVALSETRTFWVDDFCGNQVLVSDVDGDGRSDRVCSAAGLTRVSRATADGFEPATTWLGSALSNPILGDFDGNGRTDLGTFDGSNGAFHVALSTGTAFAAPVSWGIASTSGYSCSSGLAATGAADFDGDGRADVFCKLANRDEVLVGVSSGIAFSYSLFGSAVCDTAERVGTLEFDGDGKADWYCLGLGNGLMRVFPSTGSVFLSGIGAATASFCADPYYVLGDVNGDGRTDLTCSSNGRVSLSTGTAYLDHGAFGGWCTGTSSAFAGDVDGDGVGELVCNNTSAGTDDIQVRQWDGASLTAAETWLSSFCAGTLTAGDFDGDGKVDLLCDGFDVALAGTPGQRPDLMAVAENSQGGRVSLSYGLSTAFENELGLAPRVLVTGITTDDGRGGVASTAFTYAGGKFDRQERRFLGYATVRQTLPCLTGEMACPYVETQMRQDVAAAGRPQRVERRAGGGTLLTATDYEYTTLEEAPLPRRALLTDVTAYQIDGTGAGCASWPCANGTRTRTSYSHDAWGNVTQAVSHGDVDESGDEVTTVSSYFPNTTDYIVGAPAQVETFAGIGSGGTRLSSQRSFYDGSTNWQSPPQDGAPTQAAQWLDTEDRYVVSQLGRDGYGNVTGATDPTSRTASIAYDTADALFPVSETDAAGDTVSATWDAVCGVPTQTTDAAGQVTTHTYDALCRPTRSDGPLGAFRTQVYVDLGDPTAQRKVTSVPSATSGDGDQWSAEYLDGLGRTYKTTARGPSAGSTIVTERGFDARGNLSWASQPKYEGDSTYTTEFTYDSLDRVAEVKHPDGELVATSYGVRSRTTLDELGRPLTVRFDVYGQQVEQERTLSSSPVYTNYAYDRLGRMTGMMDAAGNQWSWSFDSLGRTLSKGDPDSGVWSYAYDDAGRQTSQTDAKGQQTLFTYDTGGRMATKEWQSTPPQTTSYGYSQARGGYFNSGLPTSVSSPVDTQTMDYDAAGRLARQQRTFEGVTYTLQRRYDAAGRLTGLTYPDNDTVGTPSDPIQYDAAGRLQSIPGFVSTFDWDASGRMVYQVNLNGTATTRTFSPERGHLTRILTTGPGGTLQDLQYTQDETGRITAVSSPFGTESWNYGHDDLGRLVQADNVSHPLESQSFQYDAVGNMTYNSRIGNYAYPSPGQPRPHAPATIAGGPMTYDPNGNLLTGRSRNYTWDWENLPTQINGSAFTYSPTDGLRLKRVEGATTALYPMGDDYEIVNGVVTKYISADGGGVLGKRTGANTFWHHGNHLGSITAITDAMGAAVKARTYRPFGQVLDDLGTHEESLGFTEQRTDDTGLTYLHARYYDSELGTFISPDPIHPGRVGGAAYSYAFSDPVYWSDPGGLDPQQIAIQVCGDLGCPLNDAPPPPDAGSGGFWAQLNRNGQTAGGAGGLLYFLIDGLSSLFGSNGAPGPTAPGLDPYDPTMNQEFLGGLALPDMLPGTAIPGLGPGGAPPEGPASPFVPGSGRGARGGPTTGAGSDVGPDLSPVPGGPGPGGGGGGHPGPPNLPPPSRYVIYDPSGNPIDFSQVEILGGMPLGPPGGLLVSSLGKAKTVTFGLAGKAHFLFGSRGVLNHGARWRMGVSRGSRAGDGGIWVFRISGSWVEGGWLRHFANTKDGKHIVLHEFGRIRP